MPKHSFCLSQKGNYNGYAMPSTMTFADLQLPATLLSALSRLGYESPSPIQEKAIPALLEGQDIIAQAQTGTGKTAAFALPILAKIDLSLKKPQALILAPTRELAIQVAEAFQSYARDLPGFHILPIYGGQSYTTQLSALKRGVHIVVGTPGRVMDHLRRQTLRLDALQTLVLDEADEMLNMGFIDDIEWILTQIPSLHQTALFSATMPQPIQNIAKRYLKEPQKIKIESATKTVKTIKQYYTLVAGHHKLEALTRFLEVEQFDACIIFARTKVATEELAEKLEARGYAAAALNGDMNQGLREKVIHRLKKKSLDIVVATEVAARGLDVERLDFVINYDIPYDAETYVHRIGRTGRAGREGKSLLFVTPKEQRSLRFIEQGINDRLEAKLPPSAHQVNAARSSSFKSHIVNILAQQDLSQYRTLVEGVAHDAEVSELDIAAALAYMNQKQAFMDTESENANIAIAPKALEDKKHPSKKPFSAGHKKAYKTDHKKTGNRKTKEDYHPAKKRSDNKLKPRKK